MVQQEAIGTLSQGHSNSGDRKTGLIKSVLARDERRLGCLSDVWVPWLVTILTNVRKRWDGACGLSVLVRRAGETRDRRDPGFQLDTESTGDRTGQIPTAHAKFGTLQQTCSD